LLPLSQSRGAVQLEFISAGEVMFLVEVVVNGGVNGGELLQTSHPPEADHSPFPSSEWQV
jgi:hypothetical protein